jgi:uncharacterized protein YbaA (DUF1428 family)
VADGTGGAAEGHSLHSGRPGAPKPAESEFLFRCYPDPVYGGFSTLIDKGSRAGAGYADGFVAAVPVEDQAAYKAMASAMADLFIEQGAYRVVEAWGDDVPDGNVTDFRRAVAAEKGEAIVFSWIEWPSKNVRDEAWKKVMADPRLPGPKGMPFDGKRLIHGGFATIFDA